MPIVTSANFDLPENRVIPRPPDPFPGTDAIPHVLVHVIWLDGTTEMIAGVEQVNAFKHLLNEQIKTQIEGRLRVQLYVYFPEHHYYEMVEVPEEMINRRCTPRII